MREPHGELRPPCLPDDLAQLEAVVTAEAAVLVVIDPLAAFLSGGVNSYRDQDIRRALMPLGTLAERTGAAVVVVRHLTKSGGANPLYRGGGSIGIIGAARSALLVAVDPDEPERCVVAVSKLNLGPKPDALAYRLVPDAVNPDVPRVNWEGSVTHTAADLLAAHDEDDDDRTERDAALEWLRDALSGGGLPAKEVIRRGAADGHSVTTLKRAKKKAGVRSVKLGMPSADGQKWVWEWPEGGHPGPEEAEEDHPAEHGPLRSPSANVGTLPSPSAPDRRPSASAANIVPSDGVWAMGDGSTAPCVECGHPAFMRLDGRPRHRDCLSGDAP